MSYRKINGIIQVEKGGSSHWKKVTVPIPEGMGIYATDTGTIKLGDGTSVYIDCLDFLNTNKMSGAQKLFEVMPEIDTMNDTGKIFVVKNNKIILAEFNPNTAIRTTDFENELTVKARVNHDHDDLYYSSEEIEEKITNIESISLADKDIMSFLMLKEMERAVRSAMVLGGTFMEEFNENRMIDDTVSSGDFSIPGQVQAKDGKISIVSKQIVEKEGDISKAHVFFRSKETDYLNLNESVELTKDGSNWFQVPLIKNDIPSEEIDSYTGICDFTKQIDSKTINFNDSTNRKNIKGNITKLTISSEGIGYFDKPITTDITGCQVMGNTDILGFITNVDNDGTDIDDITIPHLNIGEYTVSGIYRTYIDHKGIHQEGLGSWEWEGNSPLSVINQATTVYDGEIYLFGGYDSDITIFSEFWKYNPTSKKWTKLPEGPSGRYHSGMVTVGDCIYLYGGHDSTGNIMSDMWQYNPTSKVWIEKTGNGQNGRKRFAIGNIHNKIIIYGGNTPTNSIAGDCWEYDPILDNWKELQNSTELAVMAYAVVDDELYIFGGRDTTSNFRISDTFKKYNRLTNTWIDLPKGPIARKIPKKLGVIKNKLYLFGGKAVDFLNDCWEYDLESNQWRQLANLEYGVWNQFQSDTINNKIYTTGPNGKDNSYSPTFSDVWVYNPKGKRNLLKASFKEEQRSLYGKFSLIGNTPFNFKDYALSKVNDLLVYVGGKDRNIVKSDIQKYNTASKAWSSAASNTIGPLYKAASCSLGGSMFIFGGIDDSHNLINRFHKYNPITDTIQTLPTGPSARHSTSLISLDDGTLILHGGHTTNGPAADTWKYTISTQTWEQLATNSIPRYGHVATAIDNNIIISGGHASTGILCDTWRYSLEKNIWINCKDAPIPRADGVAWNTYNFMIVTGGITTSNDIVKSSYAYDPLNNDWLYLNDLPVLYDVKGSEEYISDTITGEIHHINFNDLSKKLLDHTTYKNNNSSTIPEHCQTAIQHNNIVHGFFWDTEDETQTMLIYGYKYDNLLEWYFSSTTIPLCTHFSINIANNTLYLFGGMNQSGTSSKNELYSYNLTNKEFTKKTSCPGGARYNSQLIEHDNDLYIFSGHQHNYGDLDDFWKYNTSTELWEEINYKNGNYPTARSSHGITSSSDNVIFVISGITYSDHTNLNDFWKYHLNDNSWTQLPDCPLAGNIQITIKQENGIIIANDQSLAKYDEINSTWKVLETINEYTIGSPLYSNNDKIYRKNNNLSESYITNLNINKFKAYNELETKYQVHASIPNNKILTNTIKHRSKKTKGITVNDELYFLSGEDVFGIHDWVIKYDLNSDKWYKVTKIPFPIKEPTVNAYKDKIYISFGVDKDNLCPKIIQIYNTFTDAWEIVETEIPGRYGHISQILNDKLYLGLGKNDTNIICKDYWEYNLLTKIISPKTSAPLGLYAATAFINNNKIYNIGGLDTNDSELSLMLSYDTINNEWHQLNSIQKKLTWSSVFINNNIPYLLGGIVPTETDENPTGNSNVNKNIYKYNFEEDNWITHEYLSGYFSDKIALAGTASYNGQLYIYGGQEQYNTGHPLTKNLLKYDPISGKNLDTIDIDPPQLFRSGVTYGDGKIKVIFGQYVNDYLTRSNVIWCFDTITKKWSISEEISTIAENGTANRNFIEVNGVLYGNNGTNFIAWDIDNNIDIGMGTPPPEVNPHIYAIVEHRDKIIISGGNVADTHVHEYDPVTKEWIRLADLPKGMSWHKMVSFNDLVYCASSYDGTIMSEFYSYNRDTNQWSQLTSKPAPNHDFGLAVYNDKIIMIAGNYTFYTKKVFAYDYITNSWEACPNYYKETRELKVSHTMDDGIYIVNAPNTSSSSYSEHDIGTDIEVVKYNPYKENLILPAVTSEKNDQYLNITRHTSSIIENDIYIYGGSVTGKPSNKLYKYNAITKQFKELTAGLIAVKDAASGIYNNKLYVSGGHDGTSPIIAIQIYDINTDTWSVMSGPTTLHKHAVTISDNMMYIIGGYTGQDLGTYNQDIFRINLTDNTAETLNDTEVHKTSRVSHTCHMYKDTHLFIIGGITASDNSNIKLINDITTAAPSVIEYDIPIKLSDHSSILLGDDIIIYGGTVYDTNEINDKIYIFNITNEAWTKYKTNGPLRTNHTMHIIDNNPCIVGGYKHRSVQEPCFFQLNVTPKDIDVFTIEQSSLVDMTNFKGERLNNSYMFHRSNTNEYSTYNSSAHIWDVVVQMIDDQWYYAETSGVFLEAKDLHTAILLAFNALPEYKRFSLPQSIKDIRGVAIINVGDNALIDDINTKNIITNPEPQIVETTKLKYRITSEDGISVHGIRVLY